MAPGGGGLHVKPGATPNMGQGSQLSLLFFSFFFCLCVPCHHPHMSVCGSAYSCLGQHCVFLLFNRAATLLFYRSRSADEQRRLAASKMWAPCETITTTRAHSVLPSGCTLLHDPVFVTFYTLRFLPVKPLQFWCVRVHSISLPNPPPAGPLWYTGEFREQPLVVPTQQPSFTEGHIDPLKEYKGLIGIK